MAPGKPNEDICRAYMTFVAIDENGKPKKCLLLFLKRKKIKDVITTLKLEEPHVLN
jgi:acyl-CoA hydrolase